MFCLKGPSIVCLRLPISSCFIFYFHLQSPLPFPSGKFSEVSPSAKNADNTLKDSTIDLTKFAMKYCAYLWRFTTLLVIEVEGVSVADLALISYSQHTHNHTHIIQVEGRSFALAVDPVLILVQLLVILAIRWDLHMLKLILSMNSVRKWLTCTMRWLERWCNRNIAFLIYAKWNSIRNLRIHISLRIVIFFMDFQKSEHAQKISR